MKPTQNTNDKSNNIQNPYDTLANIRFSVSSSPHTSTSTSTKTLPRRTLFRKSASYNNILFSPNVYFTVSQYPTLTQQDNNILKHNIHPTATATTSSVSSKEITYSTENTELTNTDSFVIVPLEMEYNPTSPLHTNKKIKSLKTITPKENNRPNSRWYSRLLVFKTNHVHKICDTLMCCNYHILYLVCCLPVRTYHFINRHKIQTLNYLISIFLHTCLMIAFEIYFYFNYVIVIEKQAFLGKINLYFNHLAHYNHDKYSPFALSLFLNNASRTDRLVNDLYISSQKSLLAQQQLLEKLLYNACQLAATFGIIFCSLFLLGVLHGTRIKWRWILAENVMMLGLLGCFEYLFFTNIIMNYNPISDAELEYLVVHHLVDYVKNNDSNYLLSYVPTPFTTYAPVLLPNEYTL